MTTFSKAFSAEVMRMARKEVKAELGALRKTVSAQRADMAALKRDVKALAAELKSLRRAVGRRTGEEPAPAAQDAPAQAPRAQRGGGRRFQFNAQALAAKREQLGLTQQAMAQLLAASPLSLSRWESGKVMPRAAQLERIQQVLKMGKRQALASLQG